MDKRIEALAKTLVTYSINVQKGDVVMISGEVIAADLMNTVLREVLLAGGHPVLRPILPGSNKIFHAYGSEEQLSYQSPIDYHDAKVCDKFVRILAPSDVHELEGVDPKKIAMVIKAKDKAKLIMLDKPWVLAGFPTKSQAKLAGMSVGAFTRFVYDSMNIDWNEQKVLQEKLAAIFDSARMVRLFSEDTDLTFSLQGRTCSYSYGTHNLPDGEIFYSPRKETVQGHVAFSYPAVHRSGQIVDGIELWFEQGKVVQAKATKNQALLEQVLDTDEGARYIGEFGIGTNFQLTRYVKNILFDEKIGGTIHLALGMAYPENGGKNKSAVHWDILKDFRTSGTIFVNGEVALENGKWKI